VGHLDLWDAFAVLISVAGPPKVALSFARLAGEHTAAEMRIMALRATMAAMLCGALVALIADPLLALFHIGHPAIMIAGGAIFFVYALRLVMHGHVEVAGGRGDGFTALLLPYIASPLALTSVIVLSALKGGWGWSAAIAVAYLCVAAVNLVVLLGLTLVVHRLPGTWVEVAGRVLGLLLAGVGVELLFDGLATIKAISAVG
jgi:small neutral amino acid transporter SnatA (MarC family)